MTTSTTTPKRLVQHIRLKAPVDRVFRALTNAEELLKWFPDVAEVDARLGGNWRFEFHQKDGGVCHASGRFLALDPERLVSYSWNAPLDDAETTLFNLTVVFKLVADGDETDLYLEETGYGEGEDYVSLFGERTNGWTSILGNLATFLAG